MCLLELYAVALVVLAFLVHDVAVVVAEVLVVPAFLALDDACVCVAAASVDMGCLESRSDSSFACHFLPCTSPLDCVSLVVRHVAPSLHVTSCTEIHAVRVRTGIHV